MKKVTLEVIKPWITQKVTDLLGYEDDVVVNYVFGMLEETQVRSERCLRFPSAL